MSLSGHFKNTHLNYINAHSTSNNVPTSKASEYCYANVPDQYGNMAERELICVRELLYLEAKMISTLRMMSKGNSSRHI